MPRIDGGRYEFNLRLFTGSVSEVCAEAESFAVPPYAVNVFPTGGSVPTPTTEVEGDVITSAFATSENGGYFMRLWNPSDETKTARVTVGKLKKTIKVSPYEIVSLKIGGEITVLHDEITT